MSRRKTMAVQAATQAPGEVPAGAFALVDKHQYVAESLLKEILPNQIGRLLRGVANDLGPDIATEVAEMILAAQPNKRPFVLDMLRRANATARVAAIPRPLEAL